MKTLLLIMTAFFSLSALNNVALAKETAIMIRAKAVDAKFIGTSVGGVRVVIHDSETGELLDEGWIKGDTGSTDTLIKTPITRGENLSTESTAGYLAHLDIDTPKQVKITLFAPYAYRQSLQEASITTWVIPGEDMIGDGIIIKMPGFIVDGWTHVTEGGVVELFTKASLLCGCPITADGYWKASDYKVKAIIMQDDKVINEIPLQFVGPMGLFSAKTTMKTSGFFKAIIYIIDNKTGNVGVDRTMFEINL